MTDINEYLRAAGTRLQESGNFQAFTQEVFAARQKCEVSAEAWQTIVPQLIETLFRPLIDRIANPNDQNYHMVILGLYLNLNGFEVEAEEWKKRAAAAAEQLDDPLTRCNAFTQYGTLLSASGRNKEAAEYLRRAAVAAESLDDPYPRCDAFTEYGALLHETGDHLEAANYLQRAANEVEQLHPLNRSMTFTVFSRLLHQLGRDAEALEYLRRAADDVEQLDSPINRANVFREYSLQLSRLGRAPEAADYLKRAAAAAELLDDPLTRCNAARQSGHFHLSQRQFTTALSEYRAAQGHLHTLLASNRYPQGISTLLSVYSDVFDAGLYTADRVFVETKSPDVLFHGVAFADGLKAVSVREGLRRHSNRRFKHPVNLWTAGPDDWSGLFQKPGGETPPTTSGSRSSIPTLRTTYTAVPKGTPTILELPEEEDDTKRELSLPVEPEELERILPDGNTVAVVFHFLRDDLYILPVRRDADGKPVVLHNDDGYFAVSGVRPAFDKLLEAQAGTLAAIKDEAWYKDGAAALREQLEAGTKPDGFDLMAVPFALNKMLRLDDLLALIEPDAAKWEDLHLVLLPDGPLYQLPLHTAAVTVGENDHAHLIDVVGSVRHALSLRTLLTLGKVEESQAGVWADGVPLRGAAFVNPASEPPAGFEGTRWLGFAPQEVENLIDNSPPSSWRIFGERGASADWLATRANMARHHPTPTLLWSVCHGGLMPDTFTPRGFPGPETVVNPSLLLADGPLSTARMVSDGYDLRGVHLWHNSCCLLGRLESADGHRQVEGYIAALTLLGCRRVTSAMWELADHAAAQFAKHFLLRLRANVFGDKKDTTHAVAVSLKEAMRAFRDDKSAGDFDHPYYWAPYTLYGLG